MERMGTEYQIFNGKEYVSLRRFWNMEGKYKTEKAKNEELEEENKRLEEENKKLKSDYDRLDKVASENVRTLDELNAEIIELKENRSIEIKTCNRYREKCDDFSKEITQLKIDLADAEIRARSWEAVARGK